MKLETIVKLIRLILNKERRGMVKASEIADAIQAGERDLYSELLSSYRTNGVIPNKLQTFRVPGTISPSSGSATVTSLSVAELVSAEFQHEGRYWDAIVARDDNQWVRKRLSDSMPDQVEPNPKHRMMTRLSGSGQFITLPEGFVGVEAIWVEVAGQRYPVQLVEGDKWGSRKLSDLITDPERPEEPLHLNIEESNIAFGLFTDGSVDMPSRLIKLMSFENVVGGDRWEGVVVSPEEFYSRSFSDLYMKKFQQKKHLSQFDEEITISAGLGNLPADYIDHMGVFYAGGLSEVEGKILDSREFLDRVNSSILAPGIDNPIARIVAGQIEVRPISITKIRLQLYKFPSPRQPIGTIEGGKFRMYPEPTESVFIKALANPSVLRPQARIYDGKIEISPSGTNTVYVDVLQFPSNKMAMCRLLRAENPTTDVVQVIPDALTAGRINYIKKLTPAVYAFTVSGRDYVFNSAGSTDTMFGPEAIPDIASKALVYLGVPKQNADAAQFEAIRQGDKTKA
jgi:hypothetical protein